MKEKGFIAIDFDGTLVVHQYPDIGDELENAIKVCLRLQETHKLILLTMRDGKELEDAVNWCKERGLEFWAVNDNPTQKEWTQSRKVYANIYIDDAAFGCPLMEIEGARPAVNWNEVERLLLSN